MSDSPCPDELKHSCGAAKTRLDHIAYGHWRRNASTETENGHVNSTDEPR